MTIYEPRFPQRPQSAMQQMRIGACSHFMWVFFVAPTDPIVRNCETFHIHLRHVSRIVQAQLGTVFLRDNHCIVYHLLTDQPGCARFVIVILDGTEAPTDLTWLLPDVYTDPNMVWEWVG
jgi:hypothetical protein